MEPPWNIGFTCPEHSKKPDRRFFNLPLDYFIGNYVKLGFPVENNPRCSVEHMWVKVIGRAENEAEELRGKLDNDPIFADAQCGDLIEFKRTEIEDFTRGE